MTYIYAFVLFHGILVIATILLVSMYIDYKKHYSNDHFTIYVVSPCNDIFKGLPLYVYTVCKR
jgi:hypothetical protein